MSANTTPSKSADLMASWMSNLLEAQRTKAQQQVNPKPAPVPPLVDQIRDLLATLPPAQTERVTTAMLVPHLRGKYRERPHLLGVAKALRILGYRPVREYTKAGAGCRFWLAPSTNY